jgi:hypothetical protein
MSQSPRAFLAVVLATVVSSCGGGSSNEGTTVAAFKAFEGDGYSFNYPGGWVERTGIESSSGSGGGVGGVNIGPPEGADLLYIGTSGLDIAITQGNIAQYSDDLTAFVDDVFRQAEGQVTSAVPHLATVAGLPAIRLEATAINVDGVETKSHVVLVYDGKTEYFLNCQYTPDGVEEMTAGCDKVVASFQVES